MTHEHRRLLVVDDDPDCRLLIASVFSEAGYQVSAAPDGTVAWEELGHGHHDLLLLDAHLPGQNGFEICAAVKQDAQLGNLPVIIMTAFGSEEARHKAEQAGADHFVTKPFRNHALLDLVRRAIASKHPS